MPSSHAPSNLRHSPSHMVNPSTTSSLAQIWPNAVAPSSCIPGAGSSFWLPHRVPAEDLSNLLLESWPVAVHLAIAGLSIDHCCSWFPGFLPWQAQDYIVCLFWDDWNLQFVNQFKVFEILNQETCFLALNRHHQRARLKVNAGLYGSSSFLGRLGDITMLIAPQSICATTRCMLPCIIGTW